eukprot:NODE_168_length_16247_cov_0.199591.p6 type:complete len:277 gc:universal NODE_168_length_16247_cov_0.199591:9933-9103(-)
MCKLLQFNMKHHFPIAQESLKVVSYFLGVTSLWLTAFILGRYPKQFPMFYVVIITVLIALRFYLYKKVNYHYFLFDFCYVLNGLVIIQIFYPTDFLFTIVFCLAHGPVAFAIAVWKNALVFHSLDKITSVCIHLLPCITIFELTWINNDVRNHKLSRNYFVTSFLVYGMWQAAYYFFVDRKSEKIDNGQRTTSYTWLKQRYNLKITFINFVTIQAIYTILTIIPTVLFYNSMYLHFSFIVFLVSVATYNGALHEMKHRSRRSSAEKKDFKETEAQQ